MVMITIMKKFTRTSDGRFLNSSTSPRMSLTNSPPLLRTSKRTSFLSLPDFLTVISFLRNRVGLWYVGGPDTPEGETRLTFEELSTASKKAANLLQSLGARRVACFLPRVPEWWIINLATIRASIILLPGNPKRTQADILARLMASEVDCIIGTPEVADKVDGIAGSLLGNLKSKILVGGQREETGWLSWEQLYSGASESCETVRSGRDDIMQVRGGEVWSNNNINSADFLHQRNHRGSQDGWSHPQLVRLLPPGDGEVLAGPHQGRHHVEHLGHRLG